jgi:NAD-dependent deacetylase
MFRRILFTSKLNWWHADGMNAMAQMEEAIHLIRRSQRIAALSGAGISTEAGIPDFRGPGGMWEDPELMERMSASGFKYNPEGFYKGSQTLFSTISRAEPTLAHRLLVRLEHLGKMEAVITQNIDGLHQLAGSTKVHELHGTLRTGHCTKCRAGYEMQRFYQGIESGRLKMPVCDSCGGKMRPDAGFWIVSGSLSGSRITDDCSDRRRETGYRQP